MTKRPRRPRDLNQLAKYIVDLATTEATSPSEEESEMAKRGRRGGLVGGNARADVLTPKRRSEIAKRAAAARWNRSSDNS